MLNRFIKTILWRVGFFPYFYLFGNPFKVYEMKIMADIMDRDSNATVIDLGCGNGTQTILNANKFRKVIGIDTNEQAIKLAKDKLSFAHMDSKIEFFTSTLERMNFPDNSIGGVVSYCVLEHIPNYKEVLGDLYRIMKPGGWLLLSVDSLSVIDDKVLLEKHRNDHHVIKYFTINEVKCLLSEKGFVNILIEPELKGKYADKLFRKGIINKFRYSKFASLVHIGLIFLTEKINQRNNEGLFLLIKCYKKDKTDGE